MALIKCRACGKEISDRAEACVKCGFPLGMDAFIMCSECNEPINSNDQHCKRCGAPTVVTTIEEIVPQKIVGSGVSKYLKSIPVIIFKYTLFVLLLLAIAIFIVPIGSLFILITVIVVKILVK